MTWTPNSWRDKPAKHIPEDYPDPAALSAIEDRLAGSPPLVFAGEVDRLRERLAEVANGDAFLLQGGDCAESFKEFTADNIRDTLRVLLQMAVVLTYGASKPVVKVGRLAGQFGKPRSSPVETIDGVTLPSYRGDNINGMAFTPEERTPDPDRLIRAYAQASSTLNLVRAFSQGGYASLDNVHKWMLGFVDRSPLGEKYAAMADKITDALNFMRACGVTPNNVPQMAQVEVYTSHEALLLGYEEAMTRRDEATGSGKWYDTSAHMLWIGHRTRQLDHAHIEFCRGVENPIGIKCGPGLEADELLSAIDLLNPSNTPGRITLISRYGADGVEEGLTPLARAVKTSGRSVVWSCDPMHGNTENASSGVKTRRFENIHSEVSQAFDIHQACGSRLGGSHLELTGEDVTECTGGARDLTDEDLKRAYRSTVDPRLNYEQSLELAMAIVRKNRGLSGASINQ